MIIFNNSIFLHSPKTGGTFTRSWIYKNLSSYNKFCQQLIPNCVYSIKDLDYVKSVLTISKKQEFDIALENDTLDCINIKIQHIALQDLDLSFTEGKKIFFFVRNPIDWIYSRVKYGVQIGVFSNIEKVLNTDSIGLELSRNLLGLDNHNADIFMMKYEYLYFNLIKMLELSDIPITNDIIQSLINKDKINTSNMTNGKFNQTCKKNQIEKILKTFDKRILDFYDKSELFVQLKKYN